MSKLEKTKTKRIRGAGIKINSKGFSENTKAKLSNKMLAQFKYISMLNIDGEEKVRRWKKILGVKNDS